MTQSEPHRVSSKGYRYTVMDGRADHDIDAASILEFLNEVNGERAFKYFKQHYRGTDAVFVCFETRPPKHLINPKVIKSIDELP